MKVKIDQEQLDNLINVAESLGLKIKYIQFACGLDSITNMSVAQYNYLLMILKKVY